MAGRTGPCTPCSRETTREENEGPPSCTRVVAFPGVQPALGGAAAYGLPGAAFLAAARAAPARVLVRQAPRSLSPVPRLGQRFLHGGSLGALRPAGSARLVLVEGGPPPAGMSCIPGCLPTPRASLRGPEPACAAPLGSAQLVGDAACSRRAPGLFEPLATALLQRGALSALGTPLASPRVRYREVPAARSAAAEEPEPRAPVPVAFSGATGSGAAAHSQDVPGDAIAELRVLLAMSLQQQQQQAMAMKQMMRDQAQALQEQQLRQEQAMLSQQRRQELALAEQRRLFQEELRELAARLREDAGASLGRRAAAQAWEKVDNPNGAPAGASSGSGGGPSDRGSPPAQLRSPAPGSRTASGAAADFAGSPSTTRASVATISPGRPFSSPATLPSATPRRLAAGAAAGVETPWSSGSAVLLASAGPSPRQAQPEHPLPAGAPLLLAPAPAMPGRA